MVTPCCARRYHWRAKSARKAIVTRSLLPANGKRPRITTEPGLNSLRGLRISQGGPVTAPPLPARATRSPGKSSSDSFKARDRGSRRPERISRPVAVWPGCVGVSGADLIHHPSFPGAGCRLGKRRNPRTPHPGLTGTQALRRSAARLEAGRAMESARVLGSV